MGVEYELVQVSARIPGGAVDAAFRRLRNLNLLFPRINMTAYANLGQLLEAVGFSVRVVEGYESTAGITFRRDWESRKRELRFDIISAIAPFIVSDRHSDRPEFIWRKEYETYFMDRIEDGKVVRYHGPLTIDPWWDETRTEMADAIELERERRAAAGLPDIDAAPELKLGTVINEGTTDEGHRWASDGTLTEITVSDDETIIVSEGSPPW